MRAASISLLFVGLLSTSASGYPYQGYVPTDTIRTLPMPTWHDVPDRYTSYRYVHKFKWDAPREVKPQPVAPKGQRGYASFYWQGQRTAEGGRFDPTKLTAAHRTLPFGTKVKVTNLRNGKSVVVRINDRGPFIKGRVIDVSLAAARVLGMTRAGRVAVTIDRLPLVAPLPRLPAAVPAAPAVQQPSQITAPVSPAGPIEAPKTIAGYIAHLFKVAPRADLSRSPPELRAFLGKVQGACGTVTAISGFRPGSRVAGSGRVSNHASGKAIDYQLANPSCALKVAKGWPGGHSTDYYKVNHFHISWAPKSGEFGRRFAHGGGRSYSAHRYAKRWKSRHRYAHRGYRRVWRG